MIRTRPSALPSGIVALFCAVVVVLATTAPIDAQIPIGGFGSTSVDTPSISVSATVEVPVAADRAVVSLEIVTPGDSPEAAALANGEARQKTMEALVRFDYGADDVTMWGYGTGSSASGSYGPPPPGGAQAFEAKSGLRLTVESLDRLDAVVSSALVAGATSVRVDMQSDSMEEVMREASAQAVRRARAQAESMAEAAGGRLGSLMSILTTPDFNALTAERYMYSGGPGSQGVVLYPPDAVVRVTVQVTWAFVDR